MALLIAALFAEVGLVLVVMPWSPLWDRNYFLEALPHLRGVVTSNYFRGAVSGLGLINIAAGIVELMALFASRPVQSAQVFRSEPAQDGR
jgi:ABC-type transport system involved in cytochrome c biogenesis permease subunit